MSSERIGDKGMTSGGYGNVVSKISPFCNAVGTVDELQSVLGVARCFLDKTKEDYDTMIRDYQKTLSSLVCPVLLRISNGKTTPEDEMNLRKELEKLDSFIEKADIKFTGFIIPGDSHNPASAQVHVGRSVCRRCERDITSFVSSFPSSPTINALLSFMNRSSLFLFHLAVSIDK